MRHKKGVLCIVWINCWLKSLFLLRLEFGPDSALLRLWQLWNRLEPTARQIYECESLGKFREWGRSSLKMSRFKIIVLRSSIIESSWSRVSGLSWPRRNKYSTSLIHDSNRSAKKSCVFSFVQIQGFERGNILVCRGLWLRSLNQL